ncbi:helix-turn-helix domain-containing protein [Arthrobacter sp. R4]|uniref:helix-turn-helix domain-containing protein n=1 Tax=Arthrobacter sp. R4 TaxID=644417 RepID=UPI003EDA5198
MPLGTLAVESPRTAVLRETLVAYLRNNRSWSATSRELRIHRQTLAYRLKRISEETDRVLNRSTDISALWIASQAWASLHPRVTQQVGDSVDGL